MTDPVEQSLARSISPLQASILEKLATLSEATPAADIARRLGYQTGQDRDRHAHDGRSMSPAQRVIFPLTALRKHGYVDFDSRRDGLSGTAYRITKRGLQALQLRKEAP